MNWFKVSKQDKELIERLKKSGSAFRFDPEKTKYRLLSSIEQLDQKPARHFNFGRVIKYSFMFASLVLLISGTFAFASTSQPGDKLFALNKWGEKIILNLPLSVEQRAKVQTYIVSHRMQALDQVEKKVDQVNANISTTNLATVKESDESFASAVEEISKNKQLLEAAGNTQAAQHLEDILDQLQTMAEQREAAIAEIEDRTTDETTRNEIQTHLHQMQNSRLKAKLQIKRFNPDNQVQIKNP